MRRAEVTDHRSHGHRHRFVRRSIATGCELAGGNDFAPDCEPALRDRDTFRLAAPIRAVPVSVTAGAPPSPQGSDSCVSLQATMADNDGSVEALDSMNGQVIGSAVTVGVNPTSLAPDSPASELVVANSGEAVHSDNTASVAQSTSHNGKEGAC